MADASCGRTHLTACCQREWVIFGPDSLLWKPVRTHTAWIDYRFRGKVNPPSASVTAAHQQQRDFQKLWQKHCLDRIKIQKKGILCNYWYRKGVSIATKDSASWRFSLFIAKSDDFHLKYHPFDFNSFGPKSSDELGRDICMKIM